MVHRRSPRIHVHRRPSLCVPTILRPCRSAMSEAPVEPAAANTPSARSRAWRALSGLRSSGASPRVAETVASPRAVSGAKPAAGEPDATPPQQLVRADELDSALSMSACAIRCVAAHSRRMRTHAAWPLGRVRCSGALTAAARVAARGTRWRMRWRSAPASWRPGCTPPPRRRRARAVPSPRETTTWRRLPRSCAPQRRVPAAAQPRPRLALPCDARRRGIAPLRALTLSPVFAPRPKGRRSRASWRSRRTRPTNCASASQRRRARRTSCATCKQSYERSSHRRALCLMCLIYISVCKARWALTRTAPRRRAKSARSCGSGCA